MTTATTAVADAREVLNDIENLKAELTKQKTAIDALLDGKKIVTLGTVWTAAGWPVLVVLGLLMLGSVTGIVILILNSWARLHPSSK